MRNRIPNTHPDLATGMNMNPYGAGITHNPAKTYEVLLMLNTRLPVRFLMSSFLTS